MSLTVHAYLRGYRVDNAAWLRNVLLRRHAHELEFYSVATGALVPLSATGFLDFTLSVQCAGSEVTVSWDAKSDSVVTKA